MPKDLYGIDSVQGLLELGVWYKGAWGDPILLSVSTDPNDYSYGMYETLCQLENEGYLILDWSEPPDRPGDLRLDRVRLTVSGHELLESLRERSRAGRWKKRFKELMWIVPTSVVTTLVTIALRGC